MLYDFPSELSLPMARPRGFPFLARATSTCGMRCGCHGRDSPDHTRAVHRAAHGYPEKRPRSRAPGDASDLCGLVWNLHLQCKHIYPNLSIHLSICPSIRHLSIHPSIRHLSMYLFIYVFMYIHVFDYTFIHICYIRVYREKRYIHTHTHIYIYVCICVWLCVYTCNASGQT